MSETAVVEQRNDEVSTEKINASSVGDTIKSTELTADQKDKLEKLIGAVPEILKKTDNPKYDEIFGYCINVDTNEHVDVSIRNEILLKFLIADEYDVETAKTRLVNTLNWRNKFQPLSAAYEEEFDQELDQLGVITGNPDGNSNMKYVTWNLYGKLKNPKKVFQQYGGEGESKVGAKEGTQFLRWRIGIMEKSLLFADFTDPSNNKIAQVHDYNNVSMLRMDPNVKASTKQIISIFGANYPELLSVKFFINVPVFMGWVFSFLKKMGIISAETLKKFQVLSNGNLSEWFGKDNLPAEYNGGKSTKFSLLEALAEATPEHDIPVYAKIILAQTKDQVIEDTNLSVD